MIKRRFGVFLLALLLMKNVQANSISNHAALWQHPYELKQEYINHLRPVGSATLSFMFWDVYRSELLTASGKYSDDVLSEELLFEINYLRNISQHELLEHTSEQWRHLGFSSDDTALYVKELETIWPDINAGDTLSLMIKNSVSSFYFNSRKIGTIEDAEFGPLFLEIWLSPATSQPKLRKQLLGEEK